MRKIIVLVTLTIFLSLPSFAKSINIRLDSPFFDNSTTTNVNNYIGKKPLLLVFFYPDCPPCEEESKIINKLYDKYKGKITIIGISLSRDRYDIGDFIKDLHIKYPIWRIHSKSQLRSIGGILATPTLVVIDKNGKIIAKCIGKRSYSFLEKQLNMMLKGESKKCSK